VLNPLFLDIIQNHVYHLLRIDLFIVNEVMRITCSSMKMSWPRAATSVYNSCPIGDITFNSKYLIISNFLSKMHYFSPYCLVNGNPDLVNTFADQLV